jgi:hypothetical protein
LKQLRSLDLSTRITHQAERAKFDALFTGSRLLQEGGTPSQEGYEPFTLDGLDPDEPVPADRLVAARRR